MLFECLDDRNAIKAAISDICRIGSSM